MLLTIVLVLAALVLLGALSRSAARSIDGLTKGVEGLTKMAKRADGWLAKKQQDQREAERRKRALGTLDRP